MIGAHGWRDRVAKPLPEFCAANILDIPVGDASMSKVQVYGVLGLVPIRETLAELKRVMTPGGRLAVFVEGPGFWQEMKDATPLTSPMTFALMRWYIGSKLQQGGIYWKGTPGLSRLSGLIQYTPESLRRAMEEAGLVVEDPTALRTYKGQPRVLGCCASKPATAA